MSAESGYRGSCLCGGIRYRAEALIGPSVYCHCTSCRKANGTAFAANAACPIEGFTLDDPDALLNSYESSPGKHRFFCSRCGSPLFTKVGDAPKHVRIRLGTLDSDYDESPVARIFVAENPSWHQLDTALPCFDGWPSAEDLTLAGSRQSDG